MMPNRPSDTLFQLIKSLQKGEKRNFKLYIKRNSPNEDLKIIQLFDLLDRMEEYDEITLLQKIKDIKKEQLANRKAHLYRQILSSLRLLETNTNIDLQVHELLDHARILYNKGLYLQSLKLLDKAKELVKANNQNSSMVEILFLEKKIESLHITRSLKDRAKQLSGESDEVMENLKLISSLSNLALELYGWYINNGHATNEAEEIKLVQFFKQHLPPNPVINNNFYQRLYLYQCYTWYAFIRQNFLVYYRYTQKWVSLFEEFPGMIEIESASYIKGLHNLLNAHFDLRNYSRFEAILKKLEQLTNVESITKYENNRVQLFVYLYTAKINQHFLQGTFNEGLKLVPYINEKIKEYSLYLDRHRVLVFYYKIASLYFGSGDFEHAIDYLNKIINWKVDLRNDLQAYARLLHLIAHYELGNFDLLEYLAKSVYRYMAKMENLGPVEEDMFKFIQGSFKLRPNELKPAFKDLLEKLNQYNDNRLASRAFAYLDIVSWLESKIKNVPVDRVIKEKAQLHKRNIKKQEAE